MKYVVPRYLLFAALLLAIAGSSAAHAQCLSSWLYKAPVTISNTGGTAALTDHQVLVTINTQALISSGKMRPDGADIRFIVNEATCATACYWIESGLNTPATRIWLKMPAIPAGGSSTVYMYYGNSTATPVSDVNCVFLLFDNFDGSALDAAKWTAYGPATATVSGGAISFSPSSSSRIIRSNATFTPPVVTEMQVLQASGNWPNIAQLKSGTWTGYGPMLGGTLIRIGWTSQSGTNYSGSWGANDRTAGATAGLWSFTWAATDDQQFTWPGGSVNTNYTNYAIGPVNVALGLLETSYTPATFSVDWVRVRKYASPEPTAAVGSEEPLRPVITLNPTSVVTCEGQPVSFSVGAVGIGLTYQWRRDGADIPLATGATYSIPSAGTAQVGTYDVVVKGSNGLGVTSTRATLAVNSAPAITSGPISRTVCRGTSTSFICTATGTNIRYQWRKNGAPIPGATSEALTIVAQPYSAGTYDVVVSGICQPHAVSAPATLTVQLDAIIVEQPLDQTVPIGGSATFSVRTMGGGTLTYQWQKDGRNIPYANLPSYTIPSVKASDAGEYNVVIRGSVCSAELTVSNKASLLVPTQSGIIDDPEPMIACPQAPASFSVKAFGQGLAYQWRHNGAPIASARQSTYTIDHVRAEHVGEYDVVVSTADGQTFVSRTASLGMTKSPAIVEQPDGMIACTGMPVHMSVTLSSPAAGYQWRRNGIPLPAGTSAFLDIAGMSEEDAGIYDVAITDACGIVTLSEPATLEMSDGPVIIEQPADISANVGETVAFAVHAVGADLHYRWRLNGEEIPGATGPACELTIATNDHVGRVDVLITDACGNAITSLPANLSLSTSSVPTLDEVTTGGARLTAIPHPARGLTQLRVTLPSGLRPAAGVTLQIFDARGCLALDLSEDFARGGYGPVEVDVSSLPAGTYYCRLAMPEWHGTLGAIVVDR